MSSRRTIVGQDQGGLSISPPLSVARGDAMLDEGAENALPSPFPEADDEQWTQFVRGMMTSRWGAVSPANCLGAFEMNPRRLADLGLVTRLSRARSRAGRTIWVAGFVPPLTPQQFLGNPRLQYKTFLRSMCDYVDGIEGGDIQKDEEMSLSGALAILHRAGPNGLKHWAKGDRFAETKELYDRVSGIF